MSGIPDSARPARHKTELALSRSWLGSMLVGLVVPLVGLAWWANRGEQAHGKVASTALAEGSEAARLGESAVRVDVIKPRAGGLARQTIQPGTIDAFETVDLYAKVSGFLKTQRVDIGSPVKQGDLLATIDVPELEKDVEEAVAAVAQAEARIALAEARVATTEAEREATAATVVQAEAEIAQQVAKRTLSEKQLERVKGLLARSAIQKEVVDEQEHDLQSSQAGERSARAAALTARAQLTASDAKVKQARADLDEARTAVRLAQARLDRTRVITDYARIVAPFDGVITSRFFHPGAFIRSASDGSTHPLLTVMRTDRMRVVVQVPDLDVALLDVGDPATVTVDALRGRTFAGTISRLARAENPTTRTMRIEIDVENPSGMLCQGMYGRATIDLRPPSKGLAIPASCLFGHSRTGQAKVYVVREGRVQPTSVTLGDDDGTTTEILSGLTAEDPVVLNARSIPEEGIPVSANLIPAADLPR
jgi:RND family efflux transporter MFP subunit